MNDMRGCPNKHLDGKVAVVTGGTFGVGRGIASALDQYGARVAGTRASACCRRASSNLPSSLIAKTLVNGVRPSRFIVRSSNSSGRERLLLCADASAATEALRTSSACSAYFHDTSTRADDAPAGIVAGVSTFVKQASSVAVTCSLICSACA